MAIILNIESSTKNCSVSVSNKGELLALVEEATANYSHGEQLHPFIEACLKEAKISLQDIDAIAVGKGPGSYTGLRIGVSAAKGLCFSLNKPLIAISSLEILAHSIQSENSLIIPMIDARRMEVYSAVFDASYQQIRTIEAEVIDEKSFSNYSNSNEIILIGDAVEKCKTVLNHRSFKFVPKFPSAREMTEISYLRYKKSDFENVAYFEPFYLKDFIVTPNKKS